MSRAPDESERSWPTRHGACAVCGADDLCRVVVCWSGVHSDTRREEKGSGPVREVVTTKTYEDVRKHEMLACPDCVAAYLARTKKLGVVGYAAATVFPLLIAAGFYFFRPVAPFVYQALAGIAAVEAVGFFLLYRQKWRPGKTYSKDKWKRKLQRLEDPYSLGSWDLIGSLPILRAKELDLDVQRTTFSALHHFVMERARK